MDTTTQILTDARDLITKRGWTQEAFSRDADGNDAVPDQNYAACFCLYGAVTTAASALRTSYAYAWDRIRRFEPNPIDFNDRPTTTKDDVVALLDKAINDIRL